MFEARRIYGYDPINYWREKTLKGVLFFLVFVLVFAFTVNICLGLMDNRNFEPHLEESVRSFNGVAYVNRLPQVDLAVATETDGDGGNWTFMVYLDGDNNLEGDCIDIFLNMSSVGSTSQVNIVAQMDRKEWKYDSRYGDWGDCKRFYVTKDLTPTPENAIENLSEVNMGDPNTLTNFVNWTINSYPASRYCLVLSDHGSGCVQSVCFDETSLNDALTLPELSQALSAVPQKMDVLYFDACLMGMIEVAYQVRDYVDVMIASEDVAYAGQPYDYYLSNLTANPSMSPSDLAHVIVSNYIEYTVNILNTIFYPDIYPSTMSGVDLSQISSLKTAVDNLAQRLNDSENIYNDEIRKARCQAEGYEGPLGGLYGWYIDLYHFAELIYQYIPDSEIRNNATQVMTSLSNAVITEDHYHHPNSHGLSIFFPCRRDGDYDGFMNEYLSTDFANDTVWDEFVNNHVSNTPARPDLVVVDVYWKPSNPMPGETVTFYADLANQGTQDANSVSVRLYKDGGSYASGTFNFPAGALRIVYTSWTAYKGSHNITWIMDEDNKFSDEWNETNNEMTKEFTVGYMLTVQTPYNHITVKIDGSTYWTDPNGNFLTYVGPGSHSVEVQTPVSLGTGARGIFVQWSDGNTSNPRTIFMDNNLSLTAEYVTQYYLTVRRNPSYIGETTGEGWYESGTVATANCTSPVPSGTGTRYVFTNWTGDAFGTSITLQLTMDGPKTVTANYKMQYNVTFQQSGSGGATNITVDNVNYSLPCSFWFDSGSSHTFSYESPVSGGPGVQYILYTSPTSPFTVSYSTTITGYYKTQFYITINSSRGSPTPSQWLDKGSSLTASVESPTETITNQTRWRCTGFSVDYGVLQQGSSYGFSSIQEPHEIEFYWIQQFWLQVDTDVSGSKVRGTGWYDNGTTASISATTPYTKWWDHRFIFVSWVSTGTNAAPITNSTSAQTAVTVNNYCTVKAAWQEQFYISITSSHGDPPPSQWVNSTESLCVNVTSPADDDGQGTRYRCVGYSVDSGELQAETSYIFTNIQNSHAISFEWQVQYCLTVETDPSGLSPEPSVSPSGFWYDGGTLVTLEAKDVEGYAFDCWTIDEERQGPSVKSITVEMDKPHATIAKYNLSKFPLLWMIIVGAIVISVVIGAVIGIALFVLKRKK